MIKVIKLPSTTAIGVKGNKNTYATYRVLRKNGNYNKLIKLRWAQQRGKCFYCFKSLKGHRINIEHMISMSNRGTNNTNNLVIACPDCNKKKGSRNASRYDLNRFKAMLKRSKQEQRKYMQNKITLEEAIEIVDNKTLKKLHWLFYS